MNKSLLIATLVGLCILNTACQQNETKSASLNSAPSVAAADSQQAIAPAQVADNSSTLSTNPQIAANDYAAPAAAAPAASSAMPAAPTTEENKTDQSPASMAPAAPDANTMTAPPASSAIPAAPSAPA